MSSAAVLDTARHAARIEQLNATMRRARTWRYLRYALIALVVGWSVEAIVVGDTDWSRITAEGLAKGAARFIAFDASIALAGPLAERGVLVALSRWDDSASPSMEGRVAGEHWHFFSHSQDVWVFQAGGVPSFPADIQLGIPQCESRLAYEAAAAGMIVVNPALSIRSWHPHASAVRSWRRKDGYRGPLLFPRLTTVEAVEPEALVVERLGRFRKREAVVRLSGSPGDFAAALAEKEADCRKKSLKIGLRSPFYFRERRP